MESESEVKGQGYDWIELWFRSMSMTVAFFDTHWPLFVKWRGISRMGKYLSSFRDRYAAP